MSASRHGNGTHNGYHAARRPDRGVSEERVLSGEGSPERGDDSGTEQSVLRLAGGQSRAFISFGLNSNDVVVADRVVCICYGRARRRETCEYL